jgi:cation:H+ antiporter
MIPASLAIIAGLSLLTWAADRFVDGAAATARYARVPPLLIGMVIVGFGTSAPEMVVSIIAALDGAPELALGNALGSNIANIGLILGVTALIAPLVVHSGIIRRELPLLMAAGAFSGVFFLDNALTRAESMLLLAGLFLLVAWTVRAGLKQREDNLANEMLQELSAHPMSLRQALFWLATGLVLLIVSSRMLVWGAVTVAQSLGVGDLFIGLTIVAIGTSLPELAASLSAAHKGEHDIAIGNVVGSCMFNLLGVAGIAGVIAPTASMSPEILTRDWSTMMALSAMLFVFAYGLRGEGRITRAEGLLMLVAYVAYTAYLLYGLGPAAA